MREARHCSWFALARDSRCWRSSPSARVRISSLNGIRLGSIARGCIRSNTPPTTVICHPDEQLHQRGTCVTLLNLHPSRNLGDSWDMSLGARLRWAARAADEPTATKGGDPSDTYKRWFGRVSGRAGWWRGSSLSVTRTGQEAIGRCAQALVTRATGSNGWTLRCSCFADDLGPYVVVLEQGWRSPLGLRHFFWAASQRLNQQPLRKYLLSPGGHGAASFNRLMNV